MVDEQEKAERVSARVATHRSKLRDAGMKPVQIWVPDTADEQVRSHLEELSHQVEHYPGAEDDRAFLYALAQDPE